MKSTIIKPQIQRVYIDEYIQRKRCENKLTKITLYMCMW